MCATCHGAYAPRYVNYIALFETPALESVASYIAVLDIIGTDTHRAERNNAEVQQAGTTSFYGYT